eukprot:TRINITY_DN12266_c0_g2_i1.p2 TRINITY_DN12266_c0_g2~~TRINITY_DN12266_c0_g2_i1.p2  ORF type:complete len:100 (+),score=3.95 TRINITY_DN12266_c0_g2_i1:376-675(+)
MGRSKRKSMLKSERMGRTDFGTCGRCGRGSIHLRLKRPVPVCDKCYRQSRVSSVDPHGTSVPSSIVTPTGADMANANSSHRSRLCTTSISLDIAKGSIL